MNSSSSISTSGSSTDSSSLSLPHLPLKDIHSPYPSTENWHTKDARAELISETVKQINILGKTNVQILEFIEGMKRARENVLKMREKKEKKRKLKQDKENTKQVSFFYLFFFFWAFIS